MSRFCRICANALHIPSSERDRANSTCALCLGALTDGFVSAVAIQVSDEFKKSGHCSTTFLLVLNMPSTMLLRECMAGCLYTQYPSSSKDVLSAQMLSKIRETTGLRPTLNSDLIITVSLEHDEFAESDLAFLTTHFPETFCYTALNEGRGGRKRKHHGEGGVVEPSPQSLFSKTRIKTVADQLTADIAKLYELATPTRECAFTIALRKEPFYVGGRYCKYSRSLPQSPWAVDRENDETKDSVSERLCASFKAYFRADSAAFLASGREDIDVRMLGSGRPFAVQLTNAREVLPSVNLADRLIEVETTVNASTFPDVRVKSLALVSSEEVLRLNVGEEEKRKSYTALCYSKTPLNEEILGRLANLHFPIMLAQKTVVRVLRRRTLLDRQRMVFSMSATLIDCFHFLLRVETQAGTYVKEFVHSDFGRTRPSLAELMGLGIGEVDILELDVEAVHLDWPPANKLATNNINNIT